MEVVRDLPLAKCITGSVGLDRLQVLGLLDEHVQRAPALAGRVGRGGRDRSGAELAQVERARWATTTASAASGTVVVGRGGRVVLRRSAVRLWRDVLESDDDVALVRGQILEGFTLRGESTSIIVEHRA